MINNKSNVSEQMRATVLAKAKSMGYTPNHVAKRLVSQKTYTVGVVIPEIHHAFFSEVVSGIEAVVYEKKYQLLLTNSAEDVDRERNVIEALRLKRVDGILLSCANNSTDEDYYKELVHSGLNLVFLTDVSKKLGQVV